MCLLKKPVAKTRPIAKVSCVPATCSSERSSSVSSDPTSASDSGIHQSESDPGHLAQHTQQRGNLLQHQNLCLSVEGSPFGLPTSERPHVGMNVNVGLKHAKGSSSSFMRSLPSLSTSFSSIGSEWRMLNEIISQDIYVENPNVPWQSIVGLENAKRIIREAIIYPVQHPGLFCGLLAPWKGLLLYGPPGNGKTLLAKALATECKTTFFNISPSTVVSKWRGDSEKLIRVLFEMASQKAPSTIFLDEVDALMSTRDHGGNSEHEASRRMKTELLVQMDGLANTEELVFVLAASNTPWDLDPALLRRLEKRVLISLPEKYARQAMFQKFLSRKSAGDRDCLDSQLPIADIDYAQLAQMTEGYSAADIRLVCREAAMNNIRSILGKGDLSIDTAGVVRLMPSLTTGHIEEAIKSTKPSARHLSDRYERWQREYGSE